MFQGAFDSDEWRLFDRRPITVTGNEAMIAEVLVEDSRGVFGRLVRMISMRVSVFTDLGLYLVGSLIICEIEGIGPPGWRSG